MGENIKLKDLYNEEQSFTDIGTIAVPKTDGSGDAYYVQRPIINYTLQDPPTHELTDADAGVFAWNAGDGTVLVGDVGNFLGSVEASAAGKTTRPIVTLTVTRHLSGATVNANGAALLIYLYEELSGSVLLDVLGETGNTDFTAQMGWGQLLLADTESREITGYAKINDPGAVTIGIEQPVGYQKADIFYSLLSEVTQEEQTVSVTENGAQTIVPTAGKSGIRKVALNVNVPSGGGNLQEKSVYITSNGTTEVTPDAGYDGMSKVKAVINVAGGGGNDYYLLKNPLGEMPTYEGGVFQARGKHPVDPKPYVTVIGGLNANSALGYKSTEVFSYKKGTSQGFTSLMFFWYAEDAETIPAALMQQFAGTWPYGDVTLVKGWNITTFSVNGEETTASTTAATLDVVNMELAAYGGIPKDNFDWAEMDAYTLSFFKDAASKEQANWNQNDSTAADFVKNRPGAYYETTPELTFTYDGNPVGKTVFNLGDGLILVKVSDTDLPTKEQFKQSSNLLTVHSGTIGDTTVNLSSPFYYLDYYGAMVWTEDTDGTSVAFVPSQEVATTTGTEVGVYFGIASATEPSDNYISSFVCKGMKLPVELPEILTQVKQSDWGAVDGAASILNRIGGFFKTSEAGTVIEVADNAQWDYTFLGCEATKVLDYPLTAEELLMLQLTTVLDGGQEVTDALYLSNRLDNPTSDVYTLYRLNCIGVWVMKKSDHTALFTCAAIVSCYGSKTIPAGTYVVRKSANPNSYVKKVTTYSTVQQKLPGTLVRPNFIDQLVMAKSLILKSSSAGSNKTFLISVNDAGTLTATETILE